MGLISRVSSRTYRSINNFEKIKMQIFVQGQELLVANVNTEAELLQFIEQAEGPLAELLITVGGAPLDFANLQNEQTVHVGGKLFGGKVHGSLARAGKVKGQTPKVDKEEKKKKKTGRAARRAQYNRRFVTAAQSFGRKKGPNCQEERKQ